jgi:hypothetical protein
MDAMRRASAFCLAVGYAVSWLVVCLSTCMTAPKGEVPACCADEPGIRSAQRECCSSAPTLQPDAAQTAEAPPADVASHLPTAVAVRLPREIARPVRAAASPPLVLRI